MGKITGETTERVITDAEGLRYWGEEKAFVIGSRFQPHTWFSNPTYTAQYGAVRGDYNTESSSPAKKRITYLRPELSGYGYGDFTNYHEKTFDSFEKNQRMIGLIQGHNNDGSLKVKVLGQGSQLIPDKNYARTYRLFMRRFYTVKSYEPFPVCVCKWSLNALDYGFGTNMFGAYYSSDTNTANQIPEAEANNYITSGFVNGYPSNFLYYFGRYYDRNFGDLFDNGFPTGSDGQIKLTADVDNTLMLGDPILNAWYTPYNESSEDYFAGALDENIDGNLYLYLYNTSRDICVKNDTLVDYELFGDETVINFAPGGTTSVQGEYAAMWKPFNLILTESESAALQYITDGTLPSDAFLYPLDEESLGSTDGSTDDGGGGGDPDGREDGDNGRTWIDTTPTKPDVPPGVMSNNNYYWMTIADSDAFFQWFWNNAGDLMDAQDLWQTIQGLYSNLSESIIRLRYMPVLLKNLGGAEPVTQVNVGQIAHIMNTQKLTLDAPIVKIGSAQVPTRNLKDPDKQYFTDMSPYSNISLYLPLYGFIDLDNNVFMGQTINVHAMYDAITGTIQYFIGCEYEGDNMVVNTVTAKCNVDIPITLQTKADSDGAIMGNMGRIGQQLAGVVNPTTAIGATLGLAGIQNEVQSAPMSLRGAVGESGMFYGYDKCYLVIRRPAYTRPANYAEKVGYPCNAQYTLGTLSKKYGGGYTECYNPYIDFNASATDDGEYMSKPTKEEIETIYAALENGVILPDERS